MFSFISNSRTGASHATPTIGRTAAGSPLVVISTGTILGDWVHAPRARPAQAQRRSTWILRIAGPPSPCDANGARFFFFRPRRDVQLRVNPVRNRAVQASAIRTRTDSSSPLHRASGAHPSSPSCPACRRRQESAGWKRSRRTKPRRGSCDAFPSASRCLETSALIGG